ncbi:hypothetical protein ACRAKI_23125 [Saccharothrix isguenensis]
MRVRPAAGVKVDILRDGRLGLRSTRRPALTYRSPVEAAMWIALSQHQGDTYAAADMLAAVWEKDPVAVRADIHIWCHHMLTAGYLEERP